MRKPWRMAIVLSAIALVAIMLAVPWYAPTASAADATGTRATVTFTVGGQDAMKTRNWLPSIANDVWTSDVLARVYDTVGQTDPVTDALVPYIIKGVDVDGDEIFDRGEKNEWLKGACPAPCLDEATWRRTIVAYYDFNGVLFHDNVQADISDVMFNYVLQSINPRFNTDMRVLWDDPNAATFPASRHLNIDFLGCSLPDGPIGPAWDGASTLPGLNSLRCALRFRLQDDFALFYRSTMAGLTLFPRHIYEDTGGGRHGDFGKAIYPASWPVPTKRLQGVPTDETAITPFNYPAAEGWQMNDPDVIGTGPFRFGTFDVVTQIARVDKYDKYFFGQDPNNPLVVLDPDLPTYIHQPFVDSIVYRVFRTTSTGVLALQAGTIDFYHWSLPPEFVGDLLNDPNMQVWANAEPGFFYMAYNMRLQPFGYTQWPPPVGQDRAVDAGLPFRQAFARLIDKPTIVRVLLQNYGVIADGTVSPANTFWYNRTLPQYRYDQPAAAAILDNAGWVDTDGDSWREFPRIGDAQFKILTPQADYDPIRAGAGAMIAQAAQGIGVNVKSEPTAFGSIVSAITAGNFDMFILGWRIGGTDPDYLFSFFHSSNAYGGQNYPGFYDSEFDSVISASRKELDEGRRQQQIKAAQGILARRLPYDVLYYRTNIEAERKDRFENYSVASGTIWNFWSIMSIQRPSEFELHPVVSVPSSIVEGGSAQVTVTVRDQDATVVSDATVRLSVTAGNGVFTGGTCTGSDTCAGSTNSAGTFSATYTAPASVPAIPDVDVTVTVSKAGYPSATTKRVVTVFPTGAQFLSITSDLSTGDLVPTGESLVFGVVVRDQDGNLAPSAQVTMSVSPSGPALQPVCDLANPCDAANVQSGLVFQAPATIPQDPTTYTVTVTATQAGYTTETTPIPFTVVRLTNLRTCPDGRQVPVDQPCPGGPLVPALDVLPILATIGAAAVVYGIIRNRKKGA